MLIVDDDLDDIRANAARVSKSKKAPCSRCQSTRWDEEAIKYLSGEDTNDAGPGKTISNADAGAVGFEHAAREWF